MIEHTAAAWLLRFPKVLFFRGDFVSDPALDNIYRLWAFDIDSSPRSALFGEHSFHVAAVTEVSRFQARCVGSGRTKPSCHNRERCVILGMFASDR